MLIMSCNSDNSCEICEMMLNDVKCIEFPKHIIAMPLCIITDPHGLKRDSLVAASRPTNYSVSAFG